jgi:hypothetical protein
MFPVYDGCHLGDALLRLFALLLGLLLIVVLLLRFEFLLSTFVELLDDVVDLLGEPKFMGRDVALLVVGIGEDEVKGAFGSSVFSGLSELFAL